MSMLQTVSLYVALAVFGLGLVYKISTWFRHGFGFDPKDVGAGTRVAAAAHGILATLFSRRFSALLAAFVGDALLQLKLFRHDGLRWFGRSDDQ